MVANSFEIKTVYLIFKKTINPRKSTYLNMTKNEKNYDTLLPLNGYHRYQNDESEIKDLIKF